MNDNIKSISKKLGILSLVLIFLTGCKGQNTSKKAIVFHRADIGPHLADVYDVIEFSKHSDTELKLINADGSTVIVPIINTRFLATEDERISIEEFIDLTVDEETIIRYFGNSESQKSLGLR